MPKPVNALHDAATAVLKKYPSSMAEAAKAFDAVLEKDQQLRFALLLLFLKSVAPKVQPSRRKAGPHRRPALSKTPSARQKIGALRAERSYTTEIFSRKLRGGRTLGEIHVQELRAIARASAETAISFLGRGYEDAVDTFACTMLANHCVSADPMALVRDAIKSTTAIAAYEQARLAAAEALRDGGAKMAQDLITAAAARSSQLSLS